MQDKYLLYFAKFTQYFLISKNKIYIPFFSPCFCCCCCSCHHNHWCCLLLLLSLNYDFDGSCQLHGCGPRCGRKMKFVVGIDGQGLRAKDRGLIPEVGKPCRAGFDGNDNQISLGIVEDITNDLKSCFISSKVIDG